MIGRIQLVLAVLCLILGMAHLAVTWPAYGQLSLEALWFAGSGSAIVCGGLMNLTADHREGWREHWPVLAANLILSLFFAIAWTMLKGPQVALGLALFLMLAGLAAARAAKLAGA